METGMRLTDHGRTLSVLALTLGLMMLGAAPVQADMPVEQTEKITWTHHDFVNNLVVFWNIDRDGYCNEDDGWVDLAVRSHQAGEEGSFFSITGTVYIELWDISDIADQNGDSCDMTDQEGTEFWADGEVQVTLANRTPPNNGSNQLLQEFRDQGRGVVEDIDEQVWDYGWVFVSLQQGEVNKLFTQHFTLKPSN